MQISVGVKQLQNNVSYVTQRISLYTLLAQSSIYTYAYTYIHLLIVCEPWTFYVKTVVRLPGLKRIIS